MIKKMMHEENLPGKWKFEKTFSFPLFSFLFTLFGGRKIKCSFDSSLTDRLTGRQTDRQTRFIQSIELIDTLKKLDVSKCTKYIGRKKTL